MRILITGKHSYIGNSVKAWLNEKERSFIVDEISLRNVDLKNIKFNNYDVVFHVAGIAHISYNKKMIPEYFRINRDLAIEVAKKAKEEGVKQFIFTSSMAIYGDDREIGDFRPIDIDKPFPTNAYGQSKLDADLVIQKLLSKEFVISILRLPMVYGKNSKGNFFKLANISKTLPIYPKLKNIRSIIHIKNLSELVRLIILKKLAGVFFPQDQEYFDTNKFISIYRSSNKLHTFFIPFLSMPIRLISLFNKTIKKVYGNKYYQSKFSLINNVNYQLFTIKDLIEELKDI